VLKAESVQCRVASCGAGQSYRLSQVKYFTPPMPIRCIKNQKSPKLKKKKKEVWTKSTSSNR